VELELECYAPEVRYSSCSFGSILKKLTVSNRRRCHIDNLRYGLRGATDYVDHTKKKAF